MDEAVEPGWSILIGVAVIVIMILAGALILMKSGRVDIVANVTAP